jgi:hypothetical protein
MSLSWIAFTYSLPSKASSSPRVTLWRRLRRLGAIALGGVQVLPDQDDCLEALQWLAQSVRQANGEALVIRVESFQDMNDQSIAQKFQEARQADYAELATKIAELEAKVSTLGETDDRNAIREALEKLYNRHSDIRQIDFFDCSDQEPLAARLRQISQALLPVAPQVAIIPNAIEDYREVRWVTRPRPHVDRLACIWLIRRFINPAAVVRYSKTACDDAHDAEMAFDMNVGQFQHQGNLCTFEVMLQSFGLDDFGLQMMAEIVHEIDLHDGLYLHPQIAGIDALLRGWLLAGFADAELETHGIALFEGLYANYLKTATQTTAQSINPNEI